MPPREPPPEWVLTHRRRIGEHIRTARIHAGHSQERLAELAGMDRQAVNRIEQGHSSPKVDSLIQIAAALGVPLSDLMR